MSMDMDNLAPAPDIDNFDAKGMDRGDSLVVEPVNDPVNEDKVEDIFDDKSKVDEADKDTPVDEPKEDESKVEDEKPRAKDGKFAPKGIPKERFDEAVGKEREAREAAERRANELERKLNATAQQQVQTQQIEHLETQLETLETKYSELMLDGDTAAATAVRKEIRQLDRAIARAESETVATQRTTQALEAQRVDTAIARLEADHALLNPDSESYDPDLVELVLSKQRTLIQSEGMAPSVALTKAATSVMGKFGKAPEPVEEPKGLAASKQAEERKAAQVKKNLDTASKQPASLKDAGVDSDKMGASNTPDFSKMTQEEFRALPASTIAKARGDFV